MVEESSTTRIGVEMSLIENPVRAGGDLSSPRRLAMHIGRLQQEFATGEMGFERHIAGQQAGRTDLGRGIRLVFAKTRPQARLRLIAVAAGSTV
jgi:hypothetical protein